MTPRWYPIKKWIHYWRQDNQTQANAVQLWLPGDATLAGGINERTTH